MKKVIAWLLVLALTAAISIGATLAYLTDTDEDVNVMTLGKVKIDQLEYERIDVESKDADAEVQEFHDNKPLLPSVTDKDFQWTTGDSYVDWEQIGKEDYTSGIWNPDQINNEVDKMVFIKNKGDNDAYARSVFAFEAGKYTTLDEFQKMVHLNLNTTDYTWEWVETPVAIPNEDGSATTNYFVATATYNKVLAPGALTEISLAQIALDKTATNEDVEAFGDTFQVLVKTQAIQADGFSDPAFALTEGFGPINAANIPFETDTPPTGTHMVTVMHYLNADPTGTKITNNVTNVVFGLTKDHADIAEKFDGVLVGDQDVPVYAYYVPNGSNYDIYLLANDKIYLPKDSTGMFLQMSALQRVDTSNLDTSRAEIMYGFAQQCSNLVEIDTSHWDTSNVTDMGRLFQQCTILPYLDVSNWDTSNVTNMYGVFGGSEILNNLDVSNWDTSKATNMECMFWHCYGLEYVDVADWNVSNVTNFRGMFSGTHNKGNMKVVPEVENWDVSSAESIQDMFYGCAQIKSLDLSKWDVSNITNMRHTFADCFGLESVNVSTWDTSKVQNFDGTFNDCTSLPYLDLSNWDTGSATTFAQLFEGCASLKTIKGIENWDVSNVTTTEEMFNSNSRGMTIEKLDLSGWNTAKLKATWNMFYGCSQLETVSVGDGWDMSNVTSSSNMFAGCSSLKGGNGTTTAGNPANVSYARVDTPETPGYLTYKAAEENAAP